MCSLLREYLGPEVPRNVIENCEYSISSQILHGALGWSIIKRIDPNQRHFRESIEELSDHIINFSLSGIRGLKLYKQSRPR